MHLSDIVIFCNVVNPPLDIYRQRYVIMLMAIFFFEVSFADEPGRNFADILMKFGRKLHLNKLSRPLNFG